MLHPQKTAPHFLLLTQTHSDSADRNGIWRFVLEEIGTDNRIEVTEEEPGIWGERLPLLAVVRGLEALEQPSRVTLITPSRDVGYGLRSGIGIWKKKDWQCNRLGYKATIDNVDLWKRIYQALQFHQVDCRVWDFEAAQLVTTRPAGRYRISSMEIENARKKKQEIPAISTGNKPFEFDFPNATRCRSKPIHSVPESDKRQIAVSRLEKRLADRIKPVGKGRAFGYVPN